MTATLSLIVAALSLCVGFLLAKVETQRDEIEGLSGDIHALWDAVFGESEDDPDPGAEEDEEPAAESPSANVVLLKRRVA